MSGNPNMQKIGKRKNPSGQKQPDWLFPAAGKPATTSTPHNDGQSKSKQEKELSKELLKRRAAGELPKMTPPTELVELIGAFLVENEFTNTTQSLRSERKKRGEKSGAVQGLPSLSTIYNEWRELKEEKASRKQIGYMVEDATAALKSEDDASSSGESDSSEESDDSEDSDVEMVDAPQVKKVSARKSSTSSSSSASSSSDSDADDEDEDLKPNVKPIVSKVTTNGLKRKASPSSQSSSSSSSDSDSSSEDEAPKAKKLKTQAASSSSEESSSASESSSDSDSSSEDIAAAPKEIKKAISFSTGSDSSSSSESSSESDSESDSDSSTNSAAQKVPLPASDSESSNSDGDSDSESDATPKKANEKSTNSDTSATLSDAPKKSSDSSSDSSSSDSDSDSKPKAKKVTTTIIKTTIRELSPPLPPTPVIKESKKTNVPFSRIPKDIKVDERLASNKFVPYDYAQKAHEDLIVTKGKGFTKEKNKKKRGSYRGGYIDVEGKKGIKFED